MSGPGAAPEFPRLPADRAVRRRTEDGSREGWTSAHSLGVPQAVPFRETWAHSLLGEAAGRAPAELAALADHHDHVLVPSVLSARQAEAEELARLERENGEAPLANAPVLEKIDALRERLADRRSGDDERLAALAGELSAAAREACRLAARAGATLDAENPSEASLVPPPSPTPQEVCAERGWPWPEDDEGALMSAWLSWVFTGIVGTAMGLSLLAAAGAVSLDALANEPPTVIAFGAALGFAATALGGQAVRLSFRWASQERCLGLPLLSRAPAIGAASLLVLAVVGIDAAVDQQGLLRLAAARADVASLGGGPAQGGPSPALLFLASLALSLPYAAYQAWAGAVKGRISARRRAEAEAAAGRREREAEHAARPEVAAARAATGAYRALLAGYRAEEARARERQERTLGEIAELEARLRPVRTELSQAAAFRIQDQLDQALGNEIERRKLERELRAALAGEASPARARREGAPKPKACGLRAFLGGLLGRLANRARSGRSAAAGEA